MFPAMFRPMWFVLVRNDAEMISAGVEVFSAGVADVFALFLNGSSALVVSQRGCK